MSPAQFIRWTFGLRTLLENLKFPGYVRTFAPATSSGKLGEQFVNEEEFWRFALNRPTISALSGTPVTLRGFAISEWLPRIPGLYFHRNSARLRESAERDVVHHTARFTVYTPVGKTKHVMSGIGTVRLLPTLNSRLVCATTTGRTWCGVPVLLRDEAFDHLNEDPNQLQADISGRWSPMPIEFSQRLKPDIALPRGCLIVDRLNGLSNIVSRNSNRIPLLGAYWTLFESQDSQIPTMSPNFAYSEFDIDSSTAIENARMWLTDYIASYRGVALTDCDEHLPWQNAEFSLRDIMAGEILQSRVNRLIRRLNSKIREGRGESLERFTAVLIEGYSRAELEILAHDQLGFPLDNIVSSNLPYPEVVSEFVSFLERRGLLQNLLTAISEERPFLYQKLGVDR